MTGRLLVDQGQGCPGLAREFVVRAKCSPTIVMATVSIAIAVVDLQLLRNQVRLPDTKTSDATVTVAKRVQLEATGVGIAQHTRWPASTGSGEVRAGRMPRGCAAKRGKLHLRDSFVRVIVWSSAVKCERSHFFSTLTPFRRIHNHDSS